MENKIPRAKIESCRTSALNSKIREVTGSLVPLFMQSVRPNGRANVGNFNGNLGRLAGCYKLGLNRKVWDSAVRLGRKLASDCAFGREAWAGFIPIVLVSWCCW
ncbi:hypothetical protein ACS0TY_026884 [Phlomoides rotata]